MLRHISFHILVAILACPMLSQGATKLKVHFEGQIHINSQSRSKQVEAGLPLDSPMGKFQIFSNVYQGFLRECMINSELGRRPDLSLNL